MVAGGSAAARGMAPVVAPKAARAIRRRLRRRASRPTEVEFKRELMARVGSSTDWQRLGNTVLDGVEALRVSTSQGPPNGQWLRGLLSVPGEGARCYDGAINNFLQDCRRALREKKATEPDSQGPEPMDVLESSQATDPDDQGAEPRQLPGSSLDVITSSDTVRRKVGRDVFILESESEADAEAAAPSHGPEEQKRPHRKKRGQSKPRAAQPLAKVLFIREEAPCGSRVDDVGSAGPQHVFALRQQRNPARPRDGGERGHAACRAQPSEGREAQEERPAKLRRHLP